MKKHFVLAGMLVILLSVMASCKKDEAKNTEEDEDTIKVETVEKPVDDLSVIRTDSVRLNKKCKLHEHSLQEMMGSELAQPSLECTVEVPSAEQSPVLFNAVMEWINEKCLDGCYSGKQMNLKDMLMIYQKHLQNSDDADSETSFTIRKVFENKNAVSFEYEGYYYGFGAAHGQGFSQGATFRKSDGKIFGWNMFRNEADLQPYLKKGLKEYFEAKTDEELNEHLMMDDIYSVNYLPKAETEPWVTPKGILIQYQSYEIACYADGQPAVLIPLKKAANLLTATANKLFEQ